MPKVSQQNFCDAPLVSVVMLAYNHAPYIGQAIESVLMQEAAFQVELIIGEDVSPDGTREIVKSYSEKFPNLIRLLLHDNNIGMIRNSLAVFEACRGKYVASLEGDDYWMSSSKLSEQVAILEDNPSLSGTFHQALNLQPDGSTSLYLQPEQCRDLTAIDFVTGNVVPTCSVVVRRNPILLTHPLHRTFPHPDWCYHVLNLEGGGTYRFVEGLMATRRIHPMGYTSATPRLKLYRERVEGVKIMAQRLEADERSALEKIMKWECLRAFAHTRRSPDILELYLREDWHAKIKMQSVLGALNSKCALCRTESVDKELKTISQLYEEPMTQQTGDSPRPLLIEAFFLVSSCPKHTLPVKLKFFSKAKKRLSSTLLPNHFELRRMIGKHFLILTRGSDGSHKFKQVFYWIALLMFAPRAAARRLLSR